MCSGIWIYKLSSPMLIKYQLNIKSQGQVFKNESDEIRKLNGIYLLVIKFSGKSLLLWEEILAGFIFKDKE